MICILFLAWVEYLFQSISPSLMQAVAVLTVILLNVSMTPLAFGLRSLFTDLVVAQEQSRVTAWASYSTSVSNILSLWAGSFDLPQVLGVPSLTQFQALSILACLSLAATVSICLCTARERNPNFDATLAEHRRPLGFGSVLRSIRQAYRCTPTRIKQVFAVQVFSWTAWFPFLFYMTSYVNTRYALSQLQSFHGWTDVATLLKSPATQVGSTALLMWTLVSFLSTTVLTRLVRQPCTTTAPTEDIATTDPALSSMHTVWIYSHVLFAACMLLTLVVKSWQGTVVLVSLVGCSWAATQWIPHAIVGAEISPRRKDYRLYDVDSDSDADADEVDELRKHRGAILGLHNLAISTPQIVAALASSGIMRIMTDMGSVEPAVWTLRAASVPAMVAATLAYRLGEF
ncbi:hypothetical protein Z517_01596 [Fonsecaea pedrosoi CBS 271.37]|uniref:Unplaced genomic scaffold supercont1.1, whole genome shotgun sequence n=1 Tax=Fonsecaea pedrosoi CBS 271.37 TaxID=1442368 RepID=A0A0D2E7U1_9EURO|nr:uncharacterized protein Z517_01596 [Fonsecaea pedrosoi CBS 271.37]KIW86201.1 hypothetical protein Z517_01596 [Fonsecaea pedrosoi CBS 271.37]